mgnify:CR=1 FL=1|uniref:Uncharacterized protein n=1 Tax=viral metagenome TaxID=1070528 RepID=A0A6C0KD92_9ZZZZ
MVASADTAEKTLGGYQFLRSDSDWCITALSSNDEDVARFCASYDSFVEDAFDRKLQIKIFLDLSEMLTAVNMSHCMDIVAALTQNEPKSKHIVQRMVILLPASERSTVAVAVLRTVLGVMRSKQSCPVVVLTDREQSQKLHKAKVLNISHRVHFV